jgi:hypothetical protein
MANLPTSEELTGASTTNAQQKTFLTNLRTYLADLLGTDSINKAAARTTLGAVGLTGDETIAGVKTFSSNPVVPTPAQFDSTTKVATTAFVKNAGSSLSTQKVFTASAAIAAADAGKRLTIAASGITLTLPAVNSVPVGTAFTIGISGLSSSSTVAAAGTDVMEGGGSSIVCAPNSQIILVSDGGGTWLRAMDTTNTGFNLRNTASIAGDGYQKLPSGLILQWGTLSIPGAGVAGSKSLPIAFPNASIGAVATHNGGGADGSTITAANISTNNTVNVNTSFPSAISATFFALGF